MYKEIRFHQKKFTEKYCYSVNYIKDKEEDNYICSNFLIALLF